MVERLLSNVCLAAIVKNERVNCMGGISSYLDCILPFIREAVIVDTGSTDGTLEILRVCCFIEMREEMILVFPSLEWECVLLIFFFSHRLDK
jgi:hypothetical protein